MKNNDTRSAYIIIDMENGFVSPESAHCIVPALGTVPACVRTVAAARAKGIPVFFVKRIYRADGSDVEMCRYAQWKGGGKAAAPGSAGSISAQAPEGLRPIPGDYSIIKPRWSAFFGTELDLILRRLGVRTVILAGTTTPNCIRTTCYDALALDYNTVILEDCCSSQTEEIQRVNIGDMRRAGAIIMSSKAFMDYGPLTVPDLLERVRTDMSADAEPPEPFFNLPGGGTGWTDKW
jgi:nicotinamidase-related amidase